MTENFQDKLHQEDVNNQKVQKFVPVLEGNLNVKNAPKIFCQIFVRQNMQNQTNAKHSINSKDIFKSTKNFFLF